MSVVPWWLAKWGVSATWADHIGWGSKGGVDYPAPRGTPILAASDGVVDYRVLSDGSSVARVTRPDGTATEMLHGVPKGKRRTVKRLEVIATSDGRRGVWGAGGSSGPHIHAHDLDKNGTRVPPFSTVPSGGGGGGGGFTDEKEGGAVMTTRTFPIKYTDNNTTKYARREGLRITTTTESGRAGRWRNEVAAGDRPFITANASKYLEDWAAEILRDKADLASVITGAVVPVSFDAAAIAAELAKFGIPTVDQIEEALADDFATVNANIDDQPTEFKITPA